MSRTILYYPTIDIPNETWIKNTLLYWDKISSIVPYKGYAMSYNVSKLCEYNCYESIYPEDVFSKNPDVFFDTLERRLWSLPAHGDGTAYINENKMFYIHGWEFMEQYPEIKRLFENVPCVNGEWRSISKKAAMAYMKTLAEFAIEGNDEMIIGTDKMSNADYLKEGYGRKIEENSLFEFVFNKYVPMPDKNVSIEQILEFKSKHRKALMDFQTEIYDLQRNLSCCENKIDEVLNEFKNRIEEAKIIAEKTLKDYSLKYLQGSLKTGFKCLIPINASDLLACVLNGLDISNILEDILNPQRLMVGTVATVGIHVAKAIVRDVKEYKRISGSNLAYIMHADRNGMYRKTK
ncbi:MAG: hypothetical protein IKU84_05020 [Clostridia bacterium]|nr:hypothetical protein [Clostridia bacterium]